MSKDQLAGAIGKMRGPRRSTKPNAVPNEKSPPGRQGRKALQVFISPEALADLWEIAYALAEERNEAVLLKDLAREAINDFLQKHGKKRLA
jgi:hypothetical protein